MADSAVELEHDVFLDEFLRLPTSCEAPTSATIKSQNIFATLQHGDNLYDIDLSILFMDAVNDKKLTPGSLLSFFTPYKQTRSDSNTYVALFRDDQDGGTQWFNEIVPIDFRQYVPRIDPFEDIPFSTTTGEVKRARVRIFTEIAARAEQLLASQHRVFLFMFLIIGRRFRLLRWDRAGVLVTPSVDYVDNPEILGNYLSRLSRLEDTSLGFDPTATRVLPGDVDFLRMDRAALPDATDLDHSERDLEDGEGCGSVTFVYVRSLFRASLASNWPRYRLEATDGGRKRHFLVGKPAFSAGDVAGRGTRGYVAFDCTSRRFVWLKDAWRLSYKVTDREGDILEKLNAAKISNVPTLVCHGDIANQITITADWWERKYTLSSSGPLSSSISSRFTTSSTAFTSSGSTSSKKRMRDDEFTHDTLASDLMGLAPPRAAGCSIGPLRQHTHYRLVVEEVCLPLKIFQYGQQLVSIVLDSMRAHHGAAVNPDVRILHRDISGGNILIFPKVLHRGDGSKRSIMWTGILSDWELSKPVDTREGTSGATQTHRMGTYQFMSVNLLSDLSRPIQISDELESFFHVLVYYAVRYLNSNCKSSTRFIQGYFDTYAGPGSTYTCGQKSVVMESSGVLYMQHPYKPLLFHSPMDNLLATMLKSFRAHYKVLEHEARKIAPPAPLAPLCRSPSPSDSGDEEDIPQCGPISSDEPPPARVFDDAIDWSIQDDIPVTSIPTPEDLKLAARVTHHKFLLKYMAKMLEHPRWRTNDRRPATPAPAGTADASSLGASSTAPVPAVVSTDNRNKRRRTKGPERNVSLPARLHVLTRRTRTHGTPRTLPVQRKQ